MTRQNEPGDLGPVLEALRECLLRSDPAVVEHDWGHYYAYGIPGIFAYVWPHPGHLTLGLMQGARLTDAGGRLMGHGPGLRLVVVRKLEDIDEELERLLRRAARLEINAALLDG